MAVFTNISKNELELFIKDYDIGNLLSFEGILEGIENTNYKILTSKNIYILTIFEKRTEQSELPFFINLQEHLVKKKFLCPKPVEDKNGKIINTLKGKSCVIISYLMGEKIKKVTEDHCKQVGNIMSLFHLNTKDFKKVRSNKLSYDEWHKIYLKCLSVNSSKFKDCIEIIKIELSFLNKNWPSSLPVGIIHGDVFQDNVFFKNDIFSGLIDFYFSCNDFLSYDIALMVNAWCFDEKNIFNQSKFKILIQGYEKNRLLTKKEMDYLSILLRGASLRILLTRIHDQLFHEKGSFVKPKNPEEYFNILRFHQKNNVKDYL